MVKTVIQLSILLILLSSCELPRYKIVERCDTIASMDICRCSDYDFNIPEKVGEPYDMPISYCQENRTTFSFEDMQTKIVPVRAAKAKLEQRARRKLNK